MPAYSSGCSLRSPISFPPGGGGGVSAADEIPRSLEEVRPVLCEHHHRPARAKVLRSPMVVAVEFDALQDAFERVHLRRGRAVRQMRPLAEGAGFAARREGWHAQ